MIRMSNEGLAQEIYYRINDDGLDFSTLAREYGEGPEKACGGFVGPVGLMRSHPALSEQLRTHANEPGKVIHPFRCILRFLKACMSRMVCRPNWM